MPTPYDEYEEYQDGEEWDYNPEMARVFSDRIAKGPTADRPTADLAPDDAIWIGTDDRRIYRNDPTDGWVVCGRGSSSDPIPELYAAALSAASLTGALTNGETIDDLLGTNLDVVDGALTASTGGDTGYASVSRDGSTVVTDASDINLEGGAVSSVTDDGDGTVTLTLVDTNTDTDTQLTDEEVQDVVGAFLESGDNVTITYDDAANTLTISATDTNTQLSAGDVRAAVEGSVDAADLTGQSGSAGEVLTSNGSESFWQTATVRTDEEIEDVVAALLASGSNVSIGYDDSGDQLTITASDTQLSDSAVVSAVESHGSRIDADVESVDGYDVYVQNSPPSTSEPYIRLEDA